MTGLLSGVDNRYKSNRTGLQVAHAKHLRPAWRRISQAILLW